MLAFAILVTGSERAADLLRWMGIGVPPQNLLREYIILSLLNTELKVIGAEIMRMAKQSCEEALRVIPEHAHNKDAQIAKAFRDLDWNIAAYIDPGHAMKAFGRVLEKCADVIDAWVCVKLRMWVKGVVTHNL
jgi:hypothetical protein